MSYEWDDLCRDCGTPVTPDTPPGSHDWHWYFVHDHIWRAAGLVNFDDGCFCLYCMEQRLGRELTAADLRVCPLNDPGESNDVPRLHALKVQLAELHPDGDWLSRNRPDSPEPPLVWRIILAMPQPLRKRLIWIWGLMP